LRVEAGSSTTLMCKAVQVKRLLDRLCAAG
jgi:hypothetical protein